METEISDSLKIETSGCGTLYATVTYNEHGAHHRVFLTMGKQGNCINALLQAMARLITYCFELIKSSNRSCLK